MDDLSVRYDDDKLAVALAISNLSVLVVGVFLLLRSCFVTSEGDFLEAGFVEDVFSHFPQDRQKTPDEEDEKPDKSKSYIEMLYLGGGKTQPSPRDSGRVSRPVSLSRQQAAQRSDMPDELRDLDEEGGKTDGPSDAEIHRMLSDLDPNGEYMDEVEVNGCLARGMPRGGVQCSAADNVTMFLCAAAFIRWRAARRALPLPSDETSVRDGRGAASDVVSVDPSPNWALRAS